MKKSFTDRLDPGFGLALSVRIKSSRMPKTKKFRQVYGSFQYKKQALNGIYKTDLYHLINLSFTSHHLY